jgi:MFS superfamily sulfate permease-like transporter
MLAGGLTRFGFVTELLSMPVRLGYLMGIAVTVIVAQLPKRFGFSVEAENLVPGAREFLGRLDETNTTALAIGVGSIALIIGLRRVAPKLPGVFLAVLVFVDVGAARRLRSWRRSEFTLEMAAFAGVALLGVLWGVGIALVLSLLNFIRRAWRPHDAVPTLGVRRGHLSPRDGGRLGRLGGAPGRLIDFTSVGFDQARTSIVIALVARAKKGAVT